MDKAMLEKIFTWWNGSTLGAMFDISRRSDFVGEDDYGNRLLRPSIEGRKRRYVVYKGLAEPSKVPADWHGWLHHTFKSPPTSEPLPRHSWEIDHKPNMTGTIYAERPQGSLKEGGDRAETTADYEAWTPDA
ncbi:MAG: NADH:ubiquinone oxidoreductase subunit NDUFA12 [Pseudomonadota bacterium]